MEKRDAINDNEPGLGPAVPEADAEVQTPAGLKILLGEDDPINALLVRATLSKAGHDVRLVSDFDSLLKSALDPGEDRPDIVITDLSMPGGEGLDVLAEIRTAERADDRSALPIAVLTADHREETRRLALLNGANIVLGKPVDPVRLINEVQVLAALALQRAASR
jgi:CheY-like chemotaxis protein